MKKLKKVKSEKQSSKSSRLYSTYGITENFWNVLFIEQNRVCAVCKTMPKSGVLCVDHIHVKGFKKLEPDEKKKYVRGLVCYMCNTGFKSFEKTVNGQRNRKSLEGTVEYFNKYPLKGEV